MKQKLSKTISLLGEFALIDNLTSRLPLDSSVVYGAGDDCAVLVKNKNLYELFTTDMSIEGVHFNIKKDNAQEVGYKAMARNISDIAAMGGIPRYALVAIGLPPEVSFSLVKKMFAGIKKCASHFSLNIVGGDVSKARKIIISISVSGEVEKKNLVTRCGARVGDILYVSGRLGGSILSKHLNFIPRVDEARFLTRHFSVTSMIDISDGLLQDLGHILKMSGVGCVIDLEKIPISRDAFKLSRNNKKRALNHALSDGEDYELLFTVSPKEAASLERKWRKRFNIRLTSVGSIVKAKGMFYQKGSHLNIFTPLEKTHGMVTTFNGRSSLKGFTKRKGYTHF